jgi:hypothetical protein
MLVLGIDTDLGRPDPDRHALDADPDPEKLCGSDSLCMFQVLRIWNI